MVKFGVNNRGSDGTGCFSLTPGNRMIISVINALTY